MKKQLKKIVAGTVPVILVAGTQVAQADEIQSVAAQAIAQAAKPPAAPQTSAPGPVVVPMATRGRRM